jgi:hypothetical protein
MSFSGKLRCDPGSLQDAHHPLVLALDAQRKKHVEKGNREATMSRILANNRTGRVLLHVVCAFRDHHWAWHWRGMVREFPSR